MKIICSFLMLLLALGYYPSAGQAAEALKLPAPVYQGTVSVEAALKQRRSVRHFSSRSLDLKQISQLLWAADGVNDPRGLRTAPSAGATHPLELYLVVGERGVTDLAPGIYHYRPKEQDLELLQKGEARPAIVKACHSQAWMLEAPVMVVIAGDFSRCTAKFGDRGIGYTHNEAGFAAQNLFLEAGALGLAAGIAGGFEDQALGQALKLPATQTPLLVLPVGYKFGTD
jgi:SagB-type dehydrogenase family enzyme